MSTKFEIPEFGSDPVKNAHVRSKLEEVARTVGSENAFFKRVEYHDVLSEAMLFFVEGAVQRKFNIELAKSKSDADGKDLEWHFYAFFSRSFRNRLEDLIPSRYSTVKTSRVRRGDAPELSNRKAFAAGVAPNVSLDAALGGDDSESRSTAHEVFGSDKTEDLATTVDRMRVLSDLEERYPVLYARLLDAVKNPAEVKGRDGKSLSYRQRTEEAIRNFHEIFAETGMPSEEFEGLESTLISVMQGWRSVRGNYRRT
jgi:hypothetical protein